MCVIRRTDTNTMLASLLSLALLEAPVATPLQTLERAHKANLLAVEATIAPVMRPKIVARLYFRRPDSLRTEIVSGLERYTLISNSEGVFDMDLLTKRVKQTAPLGVIGLRDGATAFTDVEILPLIVLNASWATKWNIPKNAKWKKTKDLTVLTYTESSPMGDQGFELGMRANGQIAYTKSGPAESPKSWTVTTMKYLPTTDGLASKFATPDLSGYEAYESGEITEPLPDRATMAGWQVTTGGRTASLKSLAQPGGAVVVFADPEGLGPSAELVPALRALTWGATKLVIVDGKESTLASAAAKAQVPGYPLVLQITNSGSIKRIWFGFKPGTAEVLAREIQSAAKG